MESELNRRIAFARAYLERYPIVIIVLAASALVSLWQLGRIGEVAARWFGPEIGPNVAAEVIGILVGGLVTYFVIDEIQSRRERRRLERDVRGLTYELSYHIGSTALILHRIARGEALLSPDDYKLKIPGESLWVRPQVDLLGEVARTEPGATRLVAVLSNPQSEGHATVNRCLEALRQRCQATDSRVLDVMPRELADAVESLERSCQDLSTPGLHASHRTLWIHLAFHLFLAARDKHRPARIYGIQE